MEAWKNTIILSIRQEISEINSLLAKISEIYPNNKVTSWLYPTKIAKIQQESFDDKYSSHLELLLDRIYFVVNLFMGHLDKTPSSSKQKNVSKPTGLSFARCFQNVWKEISQSKEIIRRKEKQNVPNEIRYESLDSKICKTCYLAFETIKGITNYLEENLNDSTSKLTKELLRLELVEATDESSMGKLCEAIKQDVFSLLARNAALNVDKREFAEKIDNMRNSEQSYIQTIKDKDNEILELLESLKTSEIKFEEINKDKNKLLTMLDLLKAEKFNLEHENFKCKSEIEELKVDQEVCKSEKANLNADLKRIKDEVRTVKEDYCSHMKFVMEVVGKQQVEIEGFHELSVKCERENGEFVELYLRKIKEIEELVKDIVTNTNFRKTANNCDSNLVIRGDPLDDMMKQIEANEESMKRLGEENVRLRKTVDKLRTMQGKLID